ncbi:hypothetical protein, partial [Staphylococcus haemolyticus]|uniref:hypothetical protein n=1 Tax=Staphylococcus haemolyticus TaxID=1283 RepID=UPI003F6835B9
QKIYKKDNFYIISIEIVFFSLIQELYVPDSLYYSLFLFLPVSRSIVLSIYTCLSVVSGPTL